MVRRCAKPAGQERMDRLHDLALHVAVLFVLIALLFPAEMPPLAYLWKVFVVSFGLLVAEYAVDRWKAGQRK